MERQIISLAEAGKRYFGVKPETARIYVKQGKIPAFRVGKNWLVSVEEMEARYQELTAPYRMASSDQEMCDLVRNNIGIIEFALLGLSNSEAMNGLINMSAEDIAKLANKLRELTDE